MTSPEAPTIAGIRHHARQLGIDLSDGDAAALLPGIVRLRAMAQVARTIARDETELDADTEGQRGREAPGSRWP